MASLASQFIEELRGGSGPFRPGPRVEGGAEGHRARLLAAMAEAVAERGFPAATVAEVVRRAQVSRRTFYEHFADREACLLATYEACSDLLVARIAAAASEADGSWEGSVVAGVGAYLGTMADEPGLARVFILDVLGLGPEALRRRRAVHRRYAELVLALAAAHRDELPGAEALDRDVVVAMIGALNELVLEALADDEPERLRDGAAGAQRLVRAMLMAALPEGAER